MLPKHGQDGQRTWGGEEDEDSPKVTDIKLTPTTKKTKSVIADAPVGKKKISKKKSTSKKKRKPSSKKGSGSKPAKKVKRKRRTSLPAEPGVNLLCPATIIE
jgi:hypothetical protein